MWIKTAAGALLNAELAETFYYDPDDNTTKAYIGDAFCDIAEGNVIPMITDAIIKNKTFVGVQ